MGEKEDAETVRNLLTGLTADDVRILALEALRHWRRSDSTSQEFSMHGDLGRALVPILAERKGTKATPEMIHLLKEPFLNQQGEPWMQPVIDFLSWIVRAGLAFPLYHQTGYPVRYRLTASGGAFLDATVDHPLLPGFLGRIAALCPGLPTEVIVHLGDARACFDHGLSRPAVVLAGLGYEAAENDVIEHLDGHAKLSLRKGAKAAERIAAVRQVIPTLLTDLGERGAAINAWDFGDILRRRRNDASHPNAVPDFSNPVEVLNLLIMAGHHLPALWSVRI